jgi:hypothetical protein
MCGNGLVFIGVKTKKVKPIEYDERCPDIGDCDILLPEGYFDKICNTPAFINCHHYCNRHNLAKRPMDWITTKASREYKYKYKPRHKERREEGENGS